MGGNLVYNGLDVQTRQILDSKGAIPSKTAADAKVAIQEMAEYSQKWHNGTSRTRSTKTSDGLTAIQAQLNNLGREIKKVNEKVYATQVGCEQCKGPHYTKDCPLKEEGKTLEESYYTQFGRPFQGGGYRAAAPGFYQRNNANPSYQERRQSMEETLTLIKSLEIQIGKISKVLQERGFGSLPSSTEANLRDHVKSILTTAEADSNSIRPIGSSQYATSVLNRSLDPFFEDYIELNDLNVPLDLRRDQVDDLMPTIEECEVVKELRARNDARMVSKKFGYPSDYDHDKKIRIDCAHNLKFYCMIVLKDMDAYRDEGMSDVILENCFLEKLELR
ncbi:integrase, catalytic region, zinc finger, CCHC-type containing protein [Tanacetum coccineum]